METFHAAIYRATSTFYEGELTSLVVPAVDGQYGVMAKHSDVVIAIVPGHMHFTLPDGRVIHAACSEGMMEVVDNRVMILVDSAEYPEEIDEIMAREQEALAREAILQKKSREEYYLAEASLKRALARLKLKHRMDL